MDLFDLDMYFSRFVPLKTTHNLMLRSAVAAVTAKHIGRCYRSTFLKESRHSFHSIADDYDADVDWFYKAASYYDKGISYLRNTLHRLPRSLGRLSVNDMSTEASQRGAIWTSWDRQNESTTPQNLNHVDSNHILKDEIEDLMTAIAVFSLYESIDGYSSEWSQ